MSHYSLHELASRARLAPLSPVQKLGPGFIRKEILMLCRRVIGRLAVVLSSALLVTGCTGNSSTSPSPAPGARAGSLQDFVSSASIAEVQGAFRLGSAPSPSGGPAIVVTGNQTVVNGGTSDVTVTSADLFSTVYIYIGGRTVGLLAEGTGSIGGYYEVQLPSPQTSVAALLSFAQSLPTSEFESSFAVADPEGRVGPASPLSHFVTQVGTGDVQVTLSWDASSDIDLHVVGPGGEEVYYGNRQSASGGELDLDSNAGCAIDDVRNENITWPTGTAPRGPYTVRVDHWSSCGVTATNYTVRINNGGQTQVVRGRFTGPGDQGGLGSGVFVATFDRASGPAAARVGSPSIPSGQSAGTKAMVGASGR